MDSQTAVGAAIDRRPHDRLPDFLPDHFRQPLDLRVLTTAELRDLSERAPQWHAAITGGRRFVR